jgi:hypothetical protein
MRVVRICAWVLLAAAALAAAASVPVEGSFSSRAKLCQRVEPSKAAELFGDAGNFVGSPQDMIVDDPKAVLAGQGPDGSTLLDESYLREHGIYPLQLKSVRFVGHWVRLGGLLLMLLAAVALLVTGPTAKRFS